MEEVIGYILCTLYRLDTSGIALLHGRTTHIQDLRSYQPPGNLQQKLASQQL